MPAFFISDFERDALRGLSHLQRCVYLLGLRPFMDVATGLVGTHKRRISYQSLAEEMYVDPIPGVRGSGSPSKTQLRRAMMALAKAGLITVESTRTQLIIRCILALTVACGKNKADSNSSANASSSEAVKTPEIPDKNSQNLTVTEQGAMPQADIPQIINYKNKKNTAHACEVKNLTPIAEDYQPTSIVFSAVAAGQGLPPSSTQTLLFIQHCKSKGKLSANWDAEFIKWLVIGKQLNAQWSERLPRKSTNSGIKNCGKAAGVPKLAVNAMPLPPIKFQEFPNKPIVWDAQYQKRYDYFSKLDKAECLAHLRRYKTQPLSEFLGSHQREVCI